MNQKSGFTLIEASVAIGVVGVLAGIMIPLIMKNVHDSRMARARNDVQVIAAAIASQLKDTACRPATAVPGLGNASGSGHAMWSSPGAAPAVVNGPADALEGVGGGALAVAGGVQARGEAPAQPNSFGNLFAAPAPLGNALFGLPTTASPANAGLGYRGPYLGNDMANRCDPWGHAYLVLGYNARGQGANGPIWVVCAGPSRAIEAANVVPGVAGAAPHCHRATWLHSGVSAENIAVRVN